VLAEVSSELFLRPRRQGVERLRGSLQPKLSRDLLQDIRSRLGAMRIDLPRNSRSLAVSGLDRDCVELTVPHPPLSVGKLGRRGG
jgi:hypothetical protein